MAEKSITNAEIALIKRMIDRGMTPALVQSYFTRPGRLVNPARIQEIKKETVGAAIVPASDAELDAFLDDFARDHPQSGLYAPPKQEKNASTFKTENGRIGLISERPTNYVENVNDIIDLYQELRAKLIALTSVGHNSLGQVQADVETFLAAFPENHEDASIIKIWMRGNNLRARLKSYEAYKANSDLYPLIEIDAAVVPIFADLVQSFNVLVGFVPSLAELDDSKAEGDKSKRNRVSLEAVKPAADSLDQVATEEARNSLEEQIDIGLAAPDTDEGRKQLQVAYSSWRNFSIALFTPIYRAARLIFGDDKLPKIVRNFRDGAVMQAGSEFTDYVIANYPTIIHFIRDNASHLSEYARTVIENPALSDFIRQLLAIVGS